MPIKHQGTSQSEGGEETDDSAFLCSPSPLQEEIQEAEQLDIKTSTPKLKQKSSSANRIMPSPDPDVTEETSGHGSSRKKKCSVKRREGSRGQQGEPGPSQAYREVLEVQKELVRSLMAQNAALAAEHRQLEQRVCQQGGEISRSLERQRQLEEELTHSKRDAERRSSAGLQTDRQPTDRLQAELRTVRQQAQELVDENDGLKLTVHRLNVELSRYQAKYRPLSPQEGSRVGGLPVKGSPPPWLLDVKYLCPLLLAYEDRINEKDSLLKDAEEEMRKLRVRVDEVVTENQKLHEQLKDTGVVSHNDWHELKEQAALVLQENQVLIEQLELQHVKTKETQNKHLNEVCKVSKRLMLLEEEKRRQEVELEESQRELSSVQAKQRHASARLENAVSWEEHCHIAGKLKRQLEEQERRRQAEVEELLHRVSALQEETRSLVVEKTNLTADVMNMKTELELLRQTDRRFQRKIGEMERQVEECKEKELTADQYLAYVVTVAERSCHERDQLICMLRNPPFFLSPSPGLQVGTGQAGGSGKDTGGHGASCKASRKGQAVPAAGSVQRGSAGPASEAAGAGLQRESSLLSERDRTPPRAARRRTGLPATPAAAQTVGGGGVGGVVAGSHQGEPDHQGDSVGVRRPQQGAPLSGFSRP